MSLEQKMDLMFEEIKGMRSDIRQLEGRMDKLDARMDGLEGRMDKLDARMDGLEGRMDKLDARMDGLEERMDKLDARMDGLEERMDKLDTRMDDLEEGLGKLDTSMNDMKAKQDMFGNVLERLAAKISLLHEQERANRFFIELQLERKFNILDQDLAAVMDVFLWLKNKIMENAA